MTPGLFSAFACIPSPDSDGVIPPVTGSPDGTGEASDKSPRGFSTGLTMFLICSLMRQSQRTALKRWPWLQAKIGTPNPPSNPSGPPALSESEAKAFVEGVETAQDA